MISKKVNLSNNQQGVVSIVVTVIMMLIMTMIVLAMSQNANREQRQALDRQLSNQAYYNAESGINDVAYFLYKYPDAPIKATDCSEFLTFALSKEPSFNSQLDGTTGTNKYTCALYDKAPLSLEFQKLGTAESKVLPIQGVDDAGNPVNIASIDISWNDADDPAGSITGACNFSVAPVELPPDCSYGGIRVDLITPSNSRTDMSKRSFITYFLPNASSGTPVSVIGKPYPQNQGIMSNARCDSNPGPKRCRATINDINLKEFYMHIRSIYSPTDISITANGASGPVRLKNAQVTIDVTGKSNDVLRRIQVRAPSQAQYDYPEFSVQTKESICKLIMVLPGSAQATNDSNGNTCPIN